VQPSKHHQRTFKVHVQARAIVRVAQEAVLIANEAQD
jgi:hypothetical protein